MSLEPKQGTATQIYMRLSVSVWVSVLAVGCGPTVPAPTMTVSCPITTPNRPDGYFGTDDLETELPSPVASREHAAQTGPPYGLKLPWTRHRPGQIELFAERVDAAGPVVVGEVLDGYGDIGFQSSAVRVP